MPTADLAVFASEESNDYVAPKAGGTYRYPGVVGQIEELNTAGVPYRLYLQSDLGKKKLPDHKAYLFLNPYVLTPLQRAAIERLKRQGKLLIFVHAPGVVGATDPAKTISEITGMTVRRATGVTRLLAEPVETPHTSPIGAVLDCLSVTLPSSAEGPAYEVADSRVTSLACYMGSAQVAVGARDFGRWKSVFVGCPGLTAEFLSRLAAWAGCRRAAEPGDAVYASDRFATIHAIFPGRKVLRLRRPARVTDLTSGNVVSENATTIELDMERGQTRWFWLDPVGGRK
jgi:hypothetical protein